MIHSRNIIISPIITEKAVTRFKKKILTALK